MPIALLWLQLLGTAAVILIAANFMARAADVIAFKTGLGRTFVGVVMLATATSLPELGTGVSSILLVGEPDLAAGDAFGSNLFNLLIIGLLDLAWRNGPILTRISYTSVIVGALSAGVIALAGIAMFIHSTTDALANWYISPVSVLILALFLLAIYLIYTFEKNSDSEDEGTNYEADSLTRAFATYGTSAAIVVGAAVFLAITGDHLAEAMGWEASFVGTQFLAISTSLPELAASFAAIRINAPELAISNVLGSNLFNMGFILTLDELAYTQGTLWAQVSHIHTLSVMMALFMTAVVIIGILARNRSRPSSVITYEAVALFLAYGSVSALVFFLG